MCESGDAVPQGIFDYWISGVGMSGGNQDAVCRERRNHLRCRHLGRECHQRPADFERRQKRHRIAIQVTKLSRIVRTLAGLVQKRAFEVHANDAGYFVCHCVTNRIDCAGDHGKVVTNQGG